MSTEVNSIDVRPSREALAQLDWGKGDGLLPVVVQDTDTLRVLMLGYANAASLEQTLATGQMTFFSRSKQRLWTKGESSGNVLAVAAIRIDCDNDTVLVSATLVMAKPSPFLSSETSAVVSMLSGLWPALPSISDSAMEKQAACAAPISSSGLVPFPPSKRVLKPYGC